MADRYRVDRRKFPNDQGCTVVISVSIDEVIEVGWSGTKRHHAHKKTTKKPPSKNGFEVTLKQRTTSF